MEGYNELYKLWNRYCFVHNLSINLLVFISAFLCLYSCSHSFFLLQNFWPALNECMWLVYHGAAYTLHLINCNFVKFAEMSHGREGSQKPAVCQKEHDFTRLHKSLSGLHTLAHEPVLLVSCVWYPDFHKI